MTQLCMFPILCMQNCYFSWPWLTMDFCRHHVSRNYARFVYPRQPLTNRPRSTGSICCVYASTVSPDTYNTHCAKKCTRAPFAFDDNNQVERERYMSKCPPPPQQSTATATTYLPLPFFSTRGSSFLFNFFFSFSSFLFFFYYLNTLNEAINYNFHPAFPCTGTFEHGKH